MTARKLSLTVVLVCVLVVGVVGVGVPGALGAGDVNEMACSNEGLAGFSGGLPDCRAFEQVSPVFKNGSLLNFEDSLREVSGGLGGLVRATSFGLFAGATSEACPLNFYVLSRGGSGWVAAAVNDVPLTVYSYASASCPPDLVGPGGATLLQLHPTAGSVYERNLYVHEGGAFVEVGPMLPAGAVPAAPTGTGQEGYGKVNYVAATPTFTHVVFVLQALNGGFPAGVTTDLWPGDGTVLSEEGAGSVSLYEYAGTGNSEPRLVGVGNAGPLEARPREGHPYLNEGAELISRCDTVPGGAGPAGERVTGNHHNAISEDGSLVFFTAVGADDEPCGGAQPAVDELYARVDGSQPDAHTLAISEPGAGAGCTGECATNASVEADFRDASFQGASRDGSRVFFTSTQQLLNGATQDPETTASAVRGGCGSAEIGEHGCNLYSYATTGAPGAQGLSLLSGGDTSGGGPQVQGVAAVSEDGSHVYFVAKGVLTTRPRQGAGGECVRELGLAACLPRAGAENLYVADTATGVTAFVATLPAGAFDEGQWNTTGSLNEGSGPMDVTGDGRYLLFTANAPLTADDTGGIEQVFRYDTAREELVRVSAGENGYDEDGNSPVGQVAIERSGLDGEEGMALDTHPAIAEDGTVVFKDSVALDRGALENECLYEENGECFEFAQNVYEYREGHTYLISPAAGVPLSVTEGPATISESGTDIFFHTRLALLPQDTDTLTDIYDARAGGGFPPAPPPAPCETSCQGAPGAPPAVGAPASFAFSGPGNPAPVAPAKARVRARVLTRAQKLTRALRACAKRPRRKRAACHARARETYGPRPRPRPGPGPGSRAPHAHTHGKARS